MLYDQLLKSMPKAAFKLNAAGAAYEDTTGNGNTLTGTLSFVSSILNPNTKALSVDSDSSVQVTTNIFKRGGESTSFSLEAWVLPTTFTGTISILSHDLTYDGLAFDGDAIRFRVLFATLGSVEIKWPVADFPEVYHIAATYSPEKIQLFINKELVGEQEITPEQFKDGFLQESSSSLYAGQSSGTERIVIDGIAIFNRVLSRSEIVTHFNAGRDVVSMADAVAQYMGTYWNGVRRDIVLARTWDKSDWSGIAVDTSSDTGSLVPANDPVTNLSLPGTWNSSFPIGSTQSTSLHGVRAEWDGDGVYVVQASLNGTVYTNLVNGQLVPGTQGLNTAGKVVDIKVAFVGGVEDDPAEIRRLTLVAYGTNSVHGSELSRDLQLFGPVSTALESNEPIERNAKSGLNFYGGYGILTAYQPGAVRTNLGSYANWHTYIPGPGAGTASTLTGAPSGGQYRRLTFTVAPPSTCGMYLGTSGTNEIPVTAGLPYSFSCKIRTNVVRTLTVGLLYYNAANAQVGSQINQTQTLVANAWTDYATVNSIAPTGAVRALMTFYSPVWGVGDTEDVGDLLIEQSAIVGSYFDGGTDGAAWLGTPNASTSVDKLYDVKNIGALEFWVKPDLIVPERNYILDQRPSTDAYMNIRDSGLPNAWGWIGGGTVYINGLPAVTDTIQPNIGEWVHIVYVPLVPYNTDTFIGGNYILASPWLGQMGLVATYPTALTAAQALTLYNSYTKLPSAKVNDPAVITVQELAGSYTNYAYDWSISSSGA